MIEAPGTAASLAQPRAILVDAPTAAVSSTDVRRRIAQGGSVAGLVPDGVAAHIQTHGLYRVAHTEFHGEV